MKNLINLILQIILIIFCFSCSPDEIEEKPLKLNSISPSYMVPNMPDFILSASGENFDSSSRIVFDGIEQGTTFLNSASLTCLIKSDDFWNSINNSIKRAGKHITFSTSNFDVYVLDSSSGTDTIRSAVLNFEYLENHKFTDLTEIAATSGIGGFPMFCIDSNNTLHVVWDGGTNIYYSRSEDSGDSWTDPAQISNHNSTTGWPDIAIDDNNSIYVIWNNFLSDKDIFFTKSEDNGNTWSSPEKIGSGWSPIITAGQNGKIVLTYNNVLQNDNSEVFCSTSVNKGETWSVPIQVSYNDGFSSNAETVIDKEGIIYTTWKDSTGGTQNVFFSYSSDFGVTWAAYKNLSNDAQQSSRPVISIDNNGHIYIVWFHLDSERRSYFTCSKDKGKNWSLSKIIPSGVFAYDPDIASDKYGNIYLIWKGEEGIFTSRSTDFGDSWSEGSRIPGDFNDADYPEIEVDKWGNVFIFMQLGDYEPNTKILFSRSKSSFSFPSN